MVPAMTALYVAAVISSPVPDDQGLLFCQAVSTIDPERYVENRVSDDPRLYGGYCVVNNGRVWNAYESVPYDPQRVYMPVDDMTAAYVFAEHIVEHLTPGEVLRCPWGDMTTVVISPVAHGTIALRAETVTGTPIYPEIEVSTARFLEELCDSTEDFVRFFKAILAAAERTGMSPATTVALKCYLIVPRWETMVRGLRALGRDIANREDGPR